MLEWIGLAVLIANVAFLAWVHERGMRELRGAMNAALKDKAKLVELIRETTDRIQAPDPASFATIQGVRHAQEAGSVLHRSDEDEARIDHGRVMGNGAL